MAAIQKADPAARRKALVIILIGVIAGAFLIFGFQRCRTVLIDWLLSDQEQLAYRIRLFCFFIAVAGSVPLFAYSAYLWSYGCKVMRAQRFPLSSDRVVRDTPILEGKPAIYRGRVIKVLAALLAVFGVILFVALWRISSVIGQIPA
jgi:hypothetical protein